jgi:hypothetical protein
MSRTLRRGVSEAENKKERDRWCSPMRQHHVSQPDVKKKDKVQGNQQTQYWTRARKVDFRLPGKESSNSHGARPVYQNYLDDLVDSDR